MSEPEPLWEPTPEAMSRWRALSLRDRLRWLEEAQTFVHRFSPPEARERRERLRAAPPEKRT